MATRNEWRQHWQGPIVVLDAGNAPVRDVGEVEVAVGVAVDPHTAGAADRPETTCFRVGVELG